VAGPRRRRARPYPELPGHELSGIVVELGHGTTGLTVGQRVFGLRLRAGRREPNGGRELPIS
jgi:NADPH:quinone reductase-like Zn-dependent oxidoreductase